MEKSYRKKIKRNLMSNFEYILVKFNYNKIICQEEKNNNKNISRIKYSKHIKIILIDIIFIIFINSFIFSESNRNILFKTSEITLKINGTGNISIFSDNYHNFGEYEIYINDHLQNISTNIYYFENNTNHIKIIFNDTLSSTSRMFENCYNIISLI